MAEFGWFLAGTAVTLVAVVLGWALNWFTASNERNHAWARQVQIRQAEVLAELTAILEGHDLSKAAVTAMGQIPDRRRYFDRWRLRLEAIIKEVRTVAFLDEGESREQGFATAKALTGLLETLDLATNEGATQDDYDKVDERVRTLKGEVNVLGGTWKGAASELANGFRLLRIWRARAASLLRLSVTY